mmetsp:Transcript_21312/g.50660  ORF Transcript_21312/g.50660 Transcript_21312/m.50660 type:complete len:623 (-) Transcript_21312:160-2028(-)|eukprot:CAMPEP_0113492122 /NCGR_PEP_ID=MMETSP0014_2-20120614/27908_1 /TAXON_ID=2857 /ORGANISM="Nitzschia sp." /LENGTH=622 /DNA_ID=CAMNT_0000385933 /DNA_START=50 /DNA_END=1918 /DNA_ORIENTATION=+ /assembly_acc=CAM_ASM_000159
MILNTNDKDLELDSTYVDRRNYHHQQLLEIGCSSGGHCESEEDENNDSISCCCDVARLRDEKEGTDSSITNKASMSATRDDKERHYEDGFEEGYIFDTPTIEDPDRFIVVDPSNHDHNHNNKGNNDDYHDADNFGVDLECQYEEGELLDINTVTRLVLKFGKTALKYGSGGNHIEDTMKSMITDWLPTAAEDCVTSEDDVYLFVGNKEIFLCINSATTTTAFSNYCHGTSTISTTGTAENTQGNNGDGRIRDNVSPDHNNNHTRHHRRHDHHRTQQTPITIISGYTEGMNLKKLSLLGEVAKDIKNRKITLQEAVLDKLDQIENEEQNPYGPIVEVLFGWMAAGSGLALVLGGCWWDVLVSTIGGAISWTVLALFVIYQPRFVDSWAVGLAAFVPAILITGIKVIKPEINVTISVLSSVAVPLPGYTVSRGLAELASNKVIRGAGHLISGIVCLLWLVVGGYLGARLVAALFTVSSTTPGEPINELWLVFFIPLLGLALNVAFQISRRDFVPAFLVSMLSYIVTFGASSFANSYVTTFLAATVATASANAWCAYTDRPQPIVLTPALVFLVSGSIGYRGLSQMFEGDAGEGASQFAQMFLVALLVMVGILAGDTLVRPDTTL